jgi:uncharacterized membrane protein YesL
MVSYYNELFFMVGISLLWWVTGGVFLGVAAVVAWLFLTAGGQTLGPGPFWLTPLLAIPAGPATAALAVVARRVARDIHVDRSFYFDGLRTFWKQALAISAIAGVGLSLLLLNLVFYYEQRIWYLQALTFLWIYIILFWIAAQIYVYPILASLERPTVLGALKTALLAAFANPFYTFVLFVAAIALTALSIVVAFLILLAWPAVMVLLGEHSLRLFLERAGVKVEDPNKPVDRRL